MSKALYRLMLSQHIGAPSIPCIVSGQLVKRGQVIARTPADKMSAYLHASASGVISALTDQYIEITAEIADERCFVPIEGDSILERIKNAGVVGMGGAGFPTAVKLRTPLKDNGAVILNAAECEPILGHNIVRIETDAAKIYKGLLYAMKAVGAKRGIIAIKEKHSEAVKALRGVLDDRQISIHMLDDLYPSGEERAVIRDTCGILLHPDQLPLEANCVVINAETAAKITDAVELLKPVITKDLTIAGQLIGFRHKILLDVPIGISVHALLEQHGGLSDDCGALYMGGPFTGRRIEPDEPITKISGGILAAMPYFQEKRKLGLLICACGPSREMLLSLASDMGAEVVGVEVCKQAVPVRGALKCENPGKCPGQAERVFSLKRKGAQVLLIGNCTDCTNTVMTIAPKLGLAVHHSTDGLLRAVGERLVRKRKL